MMNKFAVTIGLGILAVAVMGALQPASAAFPGSNGKIAFASNRDGNNEIYSMNADGTGQKNLTKNPANDSMPAWSPDGSKITFMSWRNGNEEIYVMNDDGTEQTRLTYNSVPDQSPAWSADGTQITFAHYLNGPSGPPEIYVMNADGSGQTNLTNNPAVDEGPAWSPDNAQIAFVRWRWNPPGDMEVYVMNANGTGQTNLTNNPANDSMPAWWPDGSKIAFGSDRDGPPGYPRVYVMNPDGSSPIRCIDDPSTYPAPSPDGSKIAFVRWPDGNGEIYVMNADCTGQTRLTYNTAEDWEPDWQPLLSCGDGVLDASEECDDGNNDNGDCCSAACAFEDSGSPCGDQGVECLVDDSCDGAGSCQDNGVETSGTPCGSQSDTECTDPDTCDGAGTCQANHAAGGDPCGDQGVECLVDDSCDGAGSCQDNGVETSGTPCGDPADTECTDPDTCDGAGNCQANDAASGAPCGDQGIECVKDDECDGAGNCTDNGLAPLSTPCEADGNLCTNDHCDGAGLCVALDEVGCPACETCDPALGCVVAPKDMCREPVERFKALLLLKDQSDDTKDKLIWKWIKGEKTDLGDFGDPLATDDYTLCIYEAVGGQPSVLLSATAPAGDQCAGRDCWKALGTKGFKYKDKELTPDGLDTILMKSGDDGKAKIIVKGKGAGLALPSPLDVELPVTVQLQGGNGECWEAEYFEVGVKRNEADQFKAKAGSPSGAFLGIESGLLD